MIKFLKIDDIEKMQYLHEKIFEEKFPMEDYIKKSKTKILDKYIFYKNNDVVGYAVVFNKKDELSYHIWLGGVLHNYRKQGCFAKFLDYMINIAINNNYKSITLSSYNHRSDMLRLAIKKGFKIIGTKEGSYGDGIKILFEYPIMPKEEVRISLTNLCNFRCFFCHMEGLDASNLIKLSKDKLEKILLQCKINNCESITFTGGEPLINKELIEFAIKFCNKFKYKPKLKIITNGSLIDLEFIKMIKLYEGDIKVNVSFHSMKKDVFNMITETEDNFIKTLEGINLLEREGINFRLNYVVLKGINDRKEDFKTLVLESLNRNIKSITFLELLVTDKNKEMFKYFLEYDEIKRIISDTCEEIGELTVEYENQKKIRYVFNKENQKLYLEVFKLTCRVGCKSCINGKDRTIGPDGEYYPCFVQSDEKCGNVSKNMADAFREGNRIIKEYADKQKNKSSIITS